MNEIWKPIPEFPNYAASTMGRIKRIVPHGLPNGGYAPMKIIKPMVTYSGYHCVLLSNKPINPKRKTRTVHRLILLTFKGLSSDGLQANHRNGKKSDNRLSNLEWLTPSENILHSYRTGLQIPLSGKEHWMKKHPERVPKGSSQANSKLTESDVRKIRAMRSSGKTLFEIANKFGVCFQLVSLIYRRKLWKHI